VKAHALIDPGTCGFAATVTVTVEGGRRAHIAVDSGCEHVAAMATALIDNGPFDVYEEMDWRKESRLRATVRQGLKGSYAWCPVPLGLMKAMQVAAGLGLPDAMRVSVEAGELEVDDGGSPPATA
jgi:hypothetical protein